MSKKIQSKQAPTGRRQTKKKTKRKAEQKLFGEGGMRAFSSGISSVFTANRIQVISGVLLGVLSLLSLLCIGSFIRTGGKDQDILMKLQAGLGLAEGERSANVLGNLGAWWANLLFNGAFGWGSLCLLLFLGWLGLQMMRGRRVGYLPALVRFIKAVLAVVWISMVMAGLQHLFGGSSHLEWGGAQGEALYAYLVSQINVFGFIGVIIVSALIVSILLSDKALRIVQNPKLPKHPELPRLGLWARIKSIFSRKVQPEGSDELEDEEEDESQSLELDPHLDQDGEADYAEEDERLESEIEDEAEDVPSFTSSAYTASPTRTVEGVIIERAPEDDIVEVHHRNPGLAPGVMLEHYKIPSIELLKDYELNAPEQNMAEIERNKQRIIETLASFKMRVTPSRITIGPTVTLYEVIPDQGIKVSRIKTMEEDIALSLKSEGIRIIAPMPGKGTIGIEVPNSKPQMVSMRSILASRRYNDLLETMELPVGMGKTITNEPFVFDLSKMPHLLIAGATGQGKSVGLNAIITSLLYSKRPEELKFVMVDPKMLEFSVYEELERHFLAKLPDADKAIITDMTRVVPTLNSLCIEMDNRYHQLTQARVRGIKEYNEQVRNRENVAINGGELMPYIVLIVDEFADLIMTSGKEVEQPIARLAQKARAAGIHMIIATQRPSTDVITGLIKANFPARIAFKVFSMIDSRTILDSPGANQLIGRGDMLFYQGKEMIRLQCAFMDTPESESIVSHIQGQESVGMPYMLPEYVPEDADGGTKSFNPNEKDPLFEEVARMVVNSQIGSTSNIQRKFNIGYNRAGRLMDQLEGSGVVGPQGGSKPREVLIKDMMSLERLFETLR